MIAVLAIDTELFGEAAFRQLMEEFFAGRITHSEVASQMGKTPQEIATILGGLFVIGAKHDNPAAQLEVMKKSKVESRKSKVPTTKAVGL